MQNIEIFNGRLAMLATVGYAIQEYVTGKRTHLLYIFHTLNVL